MFKKFINKLTKPRQVNIEEILKQLSSEKVKYKLVCDLIGKIEIPEDLLNKTILYFKDDYWTFPELCEKLGRIDDVFEIYRKSDRCIEAINLAQKYKLIDRIIEFTEKKEYFREGAEALKDLNPKKAAEYLVKEAHKCDKEGDKIRVINEAANLLSDDERIELYKNEGMLNYAAQECYWRKLFDEAIELWKKELEKTTNDKSKEFFLMHIAHSYMEKGDFDQAIEYYKKADGDNSRIAYVFECKGDFKTASEYYRKAGDIHNAAKTAMKGRLIETAKELYQKLIDENKEMGRPNWVAGFLEEAGRVEEAMISYEENENFKKAMEMAEKLGLKDKANAYRTINELLSE